MGTIDDESRRVRQRRNRVRLCHGFAPRCRGSDRAQPAVAGAGLSEADGHRPVQRKSQQQWNGETWKTITMNKSLNSSLTIGNRSAGILPAGSRSFPASCFARWLVLLLLTVAPALFAATIVVDEESPWPRV